MSFKITGGKGFHITFSNNITLSVQFGPCSYSDHYDDDMMEWINRDHKKSIESNEVEVAIFKKDGTWITHEYDNGADEVMGYRNIEDVEKIIEWIKNYE